MITKLFFILVLLGLGSVAAWAFTERMLDHTSGAEFCDSCHTMDIETDTYEQSVHGGNNPHGFQARCVGCHLPHDSPRTYLYEKAFMGLKDVWTEFLGDPERVDWVQNSTHADEYVFDSGCLHCHVKLEQATKDNPAAAASHKLYFSGTQKLNCVSCHANVGHLNLAERLGKEKSKTDSSDQ